jgi:hypothetical protein
VCGKAILPVLHGRYAWAEDLSQVRASREDCLPLDRSRRASDSRSVDDGPMCGNVNLIWPQLGPRRPSDSAPHGEPTLPPGRRVVVQPYADGSCLLLVCPRIDAVLGQWITADARALSEWTWCVVGPHVGFAPSAEGAVPGSVVGSPVGSTLPQLRAAARNRSSPQRQSGR